MKRLKRGDVVIKDPNYIFPKSQYSVITRFNAEKEFQCIWAPDESLMSLNQKILDRINDAPDVDPSFDFEEAYDNTCKLESIKDRINERENLKFSYLKLKMKQGKKLEDSMNPFTQTVFIVKNNQLKLI